MKAVFRPPGEITYDFFGEVCPYSPRGKARHKRQHRLSALREYTPNAGVSMPAAPPPIPPKR